MDRWVAGEVAAAEQAEIEAHVRGCRRCTSRRSTREEDRRLFQQTAPPLALGLRPRQTEVSAPVSILRPSRRRTLGGAAVLATALAAAGFLILPALQSRHETIMTKGQQRLRYFVRDGVAGTVREGRPHEQVHPGDQLRFAFDADALRGRRVAVLGRDASGKVSVYFPDGGTQAIALPVSADGLIPYSVRLDETLGPEALYALFCSEAVALGPLQGALAGGAPLAWPAACQVETVLLEKKPRP
jgi:hypothetical protein